jgi:hypothetical protein
VLSNLCALTFIIYHVFKCTGMHTIKHTYTQSLWMERQEASNNGCLVTQEKYPGRGICILQPFSHFKFCIICTNYLVILVKIMPKCIFKIRWIYFYFWQYWGLNSGLLAGLLCRHSTSWGIPQPFYFSYFGIGSWVFARVWPLTGPSHLCLWGS